MADEIKTFTMDETIDDLNNRIIHIKNTDYDSCDDINKEKIKFLKGVLR